MWRQSRLGHTCPTWSGDNTQAQAYRYRSCPEHANPVTHITAGRQAEQGRAGRPGRQGPGPGPGQGQGQVVHLKSAECSSLICAIWFSICSTRALEAGSYTKGYLQKEKSYLRGCGTAVQAVRGSSRGGRRQGKCRERKEKGKNVAQPPTLAVSNASPLFPPLLLPSYLPCPPHPPSQGQHLPPRAPTYTCTYLPTSPLTSACRTCHTLAC